MSAKRLTEMEHARMVRDWNERSQVGCLVTVRLDDGTTKSTFTTSEAWLMGGHSGVILLAGISGAYSLARVKASG